MRDWGVSALADVLNNLAWVELRDGTFERARALIERSIDVARRLDNEVEVWAVGVLGDLGFLAGDPDLARAAVERGVRMSEPLGVLARQVAHRRLGRQLLLDGRAAEAAEALEYAQSFSKDGNRTQELFIAQALAQAWLEAGEPARARAMAAAALDDSLKLGARLCAIDSALVLSATLRAEMGVAAAPPIDDVLATADRLIAETGACNMAAFVLLERAALAELRGEVPQRKASLRAALAAFEQMGATGQAARLARKLSS